MAELNEIGFSQVLFFASKISQTDKFLLNNRTVKRSEKNGMKTEIFLRILSDKENHVWEKLRRNLTIADKKKENQLVTTCIKNCLF